MPLSIGIIYCGYQCADMLDMSLSPWVEARRARLGGHSYSICAVSVPFEGFPQGDNKEDKTRTILGTHAHYDEIDHAIVMDKPMKEVEARTKALQWLVKEAKLDYLWMVDGDEQYTEQDILRITSFIEANGWVDWFRISFKNIVFTNNQYLRESFTPPRIHKVEVAGLCASWFWDDNNVAYKTADPGRMRKDVELPSFTIPESIANPLHYTWLNDQRSKRKIEYQTGRGWECSYRWDDTKGLCFNEEYFARRGLPIPEVISLPLTEAT